MPRTREDDDDDESFSSVESNDEDYEDDDSYESEEDDDGSGRTLLFLCEEGQLDIALKRVRDWDDRLSASKEEPADADASNGKETAEKITATAAVTEQMATIRTELFRKNATTGNTCLHEILAGGSCGRSAPELVERLVRLYTTGCCGDSSSNSTNNVDSATKMFARTRSIFLGQPRGSHGRTPLHWCAWSKTDPKLLKLVLNACPDALVLSDDRSHARRTPLEIAQRYWPDDAITSVLKSAQARYLPYRVRISVVLCVQRLFLKPTDGNQGDNNSRRQDQAPSPKSKRQTSNGKPKAAKRKRENKTASRTESPAPNTDGASHYASSSRGFLRPFDKKDRKIAGLAPRPWFVASVLGYACQREMRGLTLRILSYVGHGAKLASKAPKRKSATKTKHTSAARRNPTKPKAADVAASRSTRRAAKEVNDTNGTEAENAGASDTSSNTTTKHVARKKRKHG